MKKTDLRKIYKELRNGLSDAEILQASKQISVNLLELNIWDKEVFHIFLPIEEQREIITFFIVQHLWQIKKTVVLPKVVANELKHYIFKKETELVKNKWQILEPKNAEKISEEKLDVVFIPMFICDTAGHRVGYGKGFYDGFLQNCNPNIIKIGLNYFPPISKIEDTNTHDQLLDYCVTPDEIVSFTEGKSHS